MDCCNYMQYKQSYYGSQYYENVQYPGEYYGSGQHYPEFYGNTSCYGMQPWPSAAHFPDYVYNPKEARIRKAMREASRDRALGVSTTRTGRRTTQQAWHINEEESPLMMNPAHGIRGVIGSPMCGTSNFPIPNPGNGQFMQPMTNYAKHMHLTPNSSIHHTNNYLQLSPIAQLQHQTEMWHHYQESMPQNQTEPNYMLHTDIQHSQYQQQQQQHQHTQPEIVTEQQQQSTKIKMSDESYANEINNRQQQQQQQQQQQHANENVPPKNDNEKLTLPENHYETKMESVQPLIDSGHEPYMPVYHENSVLDNPYDKNLEIKMKKSVLPILSNSNKLNSKPLPDFNEAFGSTERGRFQSPPDPRLGPNKGYLDYFFPNSGMKFEDYHI